MNVVHNAVVLTFLSGEREDTIDALIEAITVVETIGSRMGDELRAMNSKDPGYRLTVSNINHNVKTRAMLVALRDALRSR